jgi:hypothetical protein
MRKPAPDFELLRLFDALRPRDYRCTVIAPDGSTTDSPKFATSAEASAWVAANSDATRDVVMTRRTNSCERN